ncbi:MAG: Phosphonate-transporting ATPase, partial [Chloroflexi bacterium]|nr:Phosphonate-transporting ATPase [Chloroflexota bacterium]
APIAPAENGPGPVPDGEPVIEAWGLTKHYGHLVAVDALDLEIRAGEIYGLLGPNGAGKTTTILMLLGLSEPTAGEVRVLGLDPTRDPRRVKRHVGYLPDSAGFYGSMTGRQNLRYTARLNGLSERVAEARISEVLDRVGLTDRADDRAETYSRGMRQRLGIADALVKDPSILILDEPTTAIDPIGVIEILDLIRGLARDEGLAILIASHLLDQVQTVCHRVGIFHQGQLIGQGTVDELAREFGDGTDLIEIEIGADGAATGLDVAGLLAEAPGVAAAEPAPAGPGEAARWRVALADGADRRLAGQEILGRVTAAGLQVERFGRARVSLERIYRSAVERALGDDAWRAGSVERAAEDLA